MTTPTKANASLAGEANADGTGLDALHTQYSDIPDAMRNARRWLVWESIPQPEGKPRKVPYYVSGAPRTGRQCGGDDLGQMATFGAAIAALASGRYAGLGFALGPDGTGNCWQGIDLDDIPKRPHLRIIADDLPGYTETSPSGNGLHAIGYGLPFGTFASNASGVEAYSLTQFFTVTGEGAGLGEPSDLGAFVAERIVPVHAAGAKEKITNAPTPHAPETPETIGEGGRNAALTSFAGYMRRKGAAEDEIEAALAKMNANRCRPPLSAREVHTIAQSIARYEPSDAALIGVNGMPANDGQLIAVDLTDVMQSVPMPPRFIVDPIIPRNVSPTASLEPPMIGLMEPRVPPQKRVSNGV